MGAKLHSPHKVTLWLAAYSAAVLNYPFWRLFFKAVEPSSAFEWLFAAATFGVLFLALNLALSLIAFPRVFKVALAILLPVTAAASYFMLEYGTVIDVNMVRNIFETNPAEAGDLLTGKLLLYVALLGMLPALAVWWLPINWRPFAAEARSKFKTIAFTLPVMAALIFPFFSDVTSVFREHRELRMTILPSNYLGALLKYASTLTKSTNEKVKVVGEDAKRFRPAGDSRRKSLFVVVVGETARADHFSLNGYPRNTNPELSKIPDLINYTKTRSCGTDTAQSVPCMFSGLGREKFSSSAAAGQENLLDILKRAGVGVHWDENQAGCKGVCVRVETDELTHAKDQTFVSAGENHDEALVDDLDKDIAGFEGDTVVVLHTMGSHGPAYWKRVPEKFAVFQPVCRDSQFSRCETQAIINAYDNTILYTDFVLSQLIDVLRKHSKQGLDTGMLYVSDHGESLGEGNIYLHGMPYAIAPEAQKHVPMVVWLSEGFRESRSIDTDCMRRSGDADTSHDNLFHSVLGAMDVSTKLYDPALDLFARCRGQQGLTGRPGNAAPL